MSKTELDIIKHSITAIPDYPHKGIIFRDITSLIENPEAFQLSINLLLNKVKETKANKILAVESRGFMFAAPIALALHIPLVLVRKKGKLPRETVAQEYELEYGKDVLEIHKDSLQAGDRVVIIDDLLATGGTVAAAVSLAIQLKAEVMLAAFVIGLPDLNGTEKLATLGIDTFTLVDFVGV